jgi:hypothetical protein
MKATQLILALGAALLPAAAQAQETNPQDLDIGIYLQKGSDWQRLLSEAVTWKTGGVLKSTFSYGIVKGDVNGHVQGARSPNSLPSGSVILIKAAEGVEYTEYQLIHLREHSDSREFRTVTGGVFHKSGGANRDTVDFDAKPAGKRMWTITLPFKLKPGEYGFLPPGAVTSAGIGSLGKMYTFRLTE